MNEELNQVQDAFDWEVEETPEETTEEVEEVVETTEPTSEPQEEPSEPQVEEPFLSIRYNKENKNLTRDEAVTLSQKGMNYDHLNEKFTNLNNQLDKLARANGMSVEQYLAQLTDAQSSYELRAEVERLRETYPTADDDVLNELAKKNIGDKESQLERVKQEESQREEAQKKAELERQLNAFSKQYPNEDPSKLDNKVYDLMNEGYTLLEAYTIVARSKQDLLNKTNEERQKHEEINNKNKSKSLGNTSNVSDNDEDAFLSGFYSD